MPTTESSSGCRSGRFSSSSRASARPPLPNPSRTSPALAICRKRSLLYQWPGVGAAGAGTRKAGLLEQLSRSTVQGLDFRRAEQALQSLVQQPSRLKLPPQLLHVPQQVFRNGLFLEIPDHGAQLVLLMETCPVVDEPQVIVIIQDHVPAFAVGVVDEHVEECRRAQGLLVRRLGPESR